MLAEDRMIGKQWALRWGAGEGLIAIRDAIQILRAALGRAESLGTLANDQLAGRLVSRLNRQGTAFLDVGAHVGSVSAAVRRSDASVAIHACEAVPAKAAALRRRFPGFVVHECAVGERAGEVTFFVNTLQSGYSSLGAPAGAPRGAIVAIQVAMKTLDELVPAIGFDVIKIDIEGAELGALRGGGRLIERCRPTIMFESAPGDENGLGYTKEALWQFFDDIGYQVIVPNRLAHDGAGLSREGFAESHLYPRRTTNYFAVASERRVEVRDRARKLLGIGATAA
jgi:FkbM family methyltransferase